MSEHVRQPMRELFREVNLSGQRIVVTEGETDRRFFQSWAASLSISKKSKFVSVDWIDVPTSELVASGLNEGNRSRVIYLAARAADEDVDIRCVADRDCGHGVAEWSSRCLMWTDFPAIESYGFDVDTFTKLNLLSLNGAIKQDMDRLIADMSFVLRELFAVRKQHVHLPAPRYDRALRKGVLITDFDVSKAVGQSIDTSESFCPRSSDLDPRSFAYGHDISGVLMAAFSPEIKNKAHVRDVEALEACLRTAIQVSNTYLCSPLFVRLSRWLER